MIIMMKSAVDEYKNLYQITKRKLEIAELFNKSYEKKIKQLEEENKAYKILLKDKLEGVV